MVICPERQYRLISAIPVLKITLDLGSRTYRFKSLAAH
jgi:hypothetical protein